MSSDIVTLKCFASGDIAYFDPVAHVYRDEHGDKFLSGSVYAHMFGYEFEREAQAKRRADILGVEPELMLEYWQSKTEIAQTFGTALHKAMEHYGKYRKLSLIDERPLGIHKTLEPIVKAFYNKRHHENALYEVPVIDSLGLRSGLIDRVVITGEKRCIIEDFKTNGDIYKNFGEPYLKPPVDFLPNTPLGEYNLQLNYYRDIVEQTDWVVEALRVHWWDGEEWITVEVDIFDIPDVPEVPKIEFEKWED